jgi:hypothetical protein
MPSLPQQHRPGEHLFPPSLHSSSSLPLPSPSSASSKSRIATANRAEGEMLVYVADVDVELLGKKRPLVVRSWSTVKEVKGVLKRRLNIPVAQQQLFFRVKNRLKELKNKHSLQDCGVCRSGETLLFGIRGGKETISLEVHGNTKCPRELRHSLLQSKRALLTGKVPVLSLEGSGGCYFLPDPRGDLVCVFKPRDEELFMENNPRGVAFSGCVAPGDAVDELRMRHGIAPGASCFREVAAYLLDTGHRTGVPETHLVESSHPKYYYRDRCPQPKLGSLCRFVSNIGVAEDYSFSRFPVREVHKIALFDIRILNCDRNAANLLVQQPTSGSDLVLVPIDHGFCLPDALEIGWCDWCWLDWPQLKEPLDEETERYILEVVDPERDAELLRERFSLPEQSMCLLKLSGMLLQKAVRAGLNLFEIASLIVRQDVENHEHSELERVHYHASKLSGNTDDARACSPVADDRDVFSMENEPSLSLWPPELNSEGRRQRSRQASCDEENEMRTGEKVHDSGRASPPGFWVEDPSLSASKLAAASLQSNFEDDTAWNDDGGGGGGGDDDGGSNTGCEGTSDQENNGHNTLPMGFGAGRDGNFFDSFPVKEKLASTPSSVAASPLGVDIDELMSFGEDCFFGTTETRDHGSAKGPKDFHTKFWRHIDALLEDLVQRQLRRRVESR